MFLAAAYGAVAHEDRASNLRLLGDHVLPEVRSYGDELGLLSPFECRPGSVLLPAGAKRQALVDMTAPDDIGLFQARAAAA